MAATSYLRNLRHRSFARLRYQRKLLKFLAAQDTRLTSSASAQTVVAVHVSNTDATGTLTFGANAGNTKIVTIGTHVYTFKTNLTEAKATGTLTNDATDFANADTVTIGSKVYTFQSSLTNVDGNVKIGASVTATLLNLKNAINLGAGTPGTDYALAMTAHTTVDATASNASTVSLRAKTVGIAGNSIATTETSAHNAFGAVTLTGGVAAIADEVKIGVAATDSLDNLIAAINDSGAGSLYATGTVLNADVTAAAGAGDTAVVTAKVHGQAGDAVLTSTDITSASWGDTHLTGGVTETWGPTFTATSHGFESGEGPYAMTSSNGVTHVPAGITSGELLWVKRIDANTVGLARTREQALLGHYVSVTDVGTGTISLTKAMTNAGVFGMLRTNKPNAIAAASDVDSLH